MKKLNFVWLLIVPAIVLAFNFFFVKNVGKFYMNWTDSSYAYLFNGMNLANGTMEVGHIDHPGTTVQITTAFLVKTIHVVSGKNPDLVADVLTDPEKYLHILSFIYVMLSGIILFYLGNVVKRLTDNIPLAIFIQSGILISFVSLTCMADIRPEPFLIFGIYILVALCFSFIYEKEISARRMYGYGLKFGIICAFLIVTKMTSMPLILLPIFLLRKWKSWFIYFTTLGTFTYLFLIPALSKLTFILNWIEKLFSHSGQYGSGEKKIIDFTEYKLNLVHTFRSDIPFMISCLFIITALIILMIRKKINYTSWKSDARPRLLIGIFVVTLISILIIAKHYASHYLIPVFGLMTLGIFLACSILFSPTNRFAVLLKNTKTQITGIALLAIFCSFNDYDNYSFNKNLENPKYETALVMSKYKDVPRLYMTYEFYFAEIPPAIYFGTCYAGDTRFDYYKKLDKIYPDAYFYSIPDNSFHKWGSTFDLEDLVAKNAQVLVSFYIDDSIKIKKSLDVLRQLNRGNKVIDLKRVYVNPVSGEQLYEMNRIGKIKTIPDSALTITCDVENVLEGSLVSTDESTRFRGLDLRTTQEKHFGTASLALNGVDEYGFGYTIDVSSKKHFEISVWRKSKSGKGALAATEENGNIYETSTSVVEEGENGWEKIRMKIDLPQDYAGSELLVFVWSEHEICYFDDFTVIQY